MVSFGLGNKSKPLLGVDIGSSAVKIVEVVANKDGLALMRYRIEPLDDDAVQDGVVVNTEKVSDAITSALKAMKIKTKDAALCVSGASVITKTIMISKDVSERQLESEIEMEADQHIPFPLDDVSLDFCILGPSQESPDNNDVMLVACRKEAIEVIDDICADSGLLAKVIDFEPYSQQRIVHAVMKANDISFDSVAAYVDFGATYFRVKFLHQGQIVYSREQTFGAKQLENDLSSILGISIEDAKNQILSPDLLPADVDAQVFTPFSTQVLQQMTRSLQLFFAATNFNDVDCIIIGGGAASLKGLIALLKEDLGTTVIGVDPSAFMNCSAIKDKTRFSKEAPALGLACGLAMWGC